MNANNFFPNIENPNDTRDLDTKSDKKPIRSNNTLYSNANKTASKKNFDNDKCN